MVVSSKERTSETGLIIHEIKSNQIKNCTNNENGKLMKKMKKDFGRE
jgi:hypothetical protein